MCEPRTVNGYSRGGLLGNLMFVITIHLNPSPDPETNHTTANNCHCTVTVII